MASAPSLRRLPDVASDPRTGNAGLLDWVGMRGIDACVTLAGDYDAPIRCSARVAAFVDLARADVRGIHMSRLYLHVDRTLSEQTLTPATLHHLLQDFLDSHRDLSTRAMVRIQFDHLVRRRALKSDHSGWKSYPITLTGLLDQGRFDLELDCQVLYSSTCPASAALARQLIQDRFLLDFADGETPLDRDRVLAWLGSEQGICATPHSQRSIADVRVKLTPGLNEFPIVDVIDCIERAVQTPVQTAVKREDEQAFAQLNGSNLMFCEDAARRMSEALDSDPRVVDFRVRASHLESLHPHDAVAIATKGVAGGYRAGIDA